MPVTKLDTQSFLQLQQNGHVVVDVRSPGEYTHAHIPGAYSMPLFTDEERKLVGTAYKQESRETAVKIGLDFYGVKMRGMVEYVEQLLKSDNKGKTILVHCWRGGMRSGAIAWLLDLYGFEVYTLAGGYKAYRRWVLGQFEKEWKLNVLGGYAGSGKTELLHRLQEGGEKIIDLEDVAKHKGSAFGKMGQPQPGQEMFENLLAAKLAMCTGHDRSIWVEDESQRIGLVNIPGAFWRCMRAAPLYFLDIPFEKRLEHVVKEYGTITKEDLINAIVRISKRLGGLETKTAVNCLLENNVPGCFSILLHYYDKQYRKALHAREDIETVMTTITGNELLASIIR